MPDTEHKPSRVNLEAICALCKANSRILESIDISGLQPAERWSALISAIHENPLGWRTGADSITKERYVICPTCAGKMTLIESGAIPRFSLFSRCPKCHCIRVSTKYDAGAGKSPLLPAEHLVRTCKRCGYQFPELPHG